MNPTFFLLAGALTTLPPAPVSHPAAAPPAARAPLEESRYAAYWLTKADDKKNQYQTLLITRMPLAELPKRMELHALIEQLRKKGDPTPQLLEYPALTINTYRRDSIWNHDGVPLKPLKRFNDLNEKECTVEVDGVGRRYEACPLADAVRLLKDPEGKERISRIHPPLGGMEQTARALRLLLEEQMKEDEGKKK